MILVPGCGRGHDVRAISECFPEATVQGLDIAATALREARRYATAGSESYHLVDIFELDDCPLGGLADVIWEHTCFCAIDPERRDDYVETVARLLKPSGEFLGVFYLDPYGKGHKPGGGPPHGTSKSELRKRFGTRFEILEQWSPARTYPGREGAEWVLRLRRL